MGDLLLDSGGLSDVGEQLRMQLIRYWDRGISRQRQKCLLGGLGVILFLLVLFGIYCGMAGPSYFEELRQNWKWVITLSGLFLGMLTLDVYMPITSDHFVSEAERCILRENLQGRGREFLEALERRGDPARRKIEKLMNNLLLI